MAFRLFDLNPEQQDAVRATEGPLLILAGAGTGKTRVITSRIAYMLGSGIAPQQILAVTFTNKAANEMRERLGRIVAPAPAKQVTMCTFHALCLRVLRAGIDRLGYKNNFAIFTESDQLGLLRKIITRTAARDEKLDPNLAKNLISRAKNLGVNAPVDEQSLAGAVFARYQQELKQFNAVDFDDLLLLAVKLFNEHEEVRVRWEERFAYIMVDEFQDTNRLQLELISLLAMGRKNVCVVGDDDQSIYGWRGAEVSNILEFEAHFANPKIVKLEQNYRSTNAILGAANSVIRHNPRRRPKKLWSAHPDGEKVRIAIAPNEREEAQFAVEEIHRRCTADGVAWRDCAVLYRMNAQSRLFEENCRRLKVPYRLVGGRSFFDRREIKDLLAYLGAMLNPHDDMSLLRIINTPARGISPQTVERALAESVQRKSSLFTVLCDPDFATTLSTRASAAIESFRTFLEDHEARAAAPLAKFDAVLSTLLTESGYLGDLQRTASSPEDALSREGNVKEMLNALAQYQKRAGGDLRGFLDEISLDRHREEEDDKADQSDGVTLITLHAAKGLEFPIVYLVGLEEGILPHERSKGEGTIDEERRLLYVGITRAMRSLTISHCATRQKFGSFISCQPSSFLREISPEFFETIDLQKLRSEPVTEEKARDRFAALRAAVAAAK